MRHKLDIWLKEKPWIIRLAALLSLAWLIAAVPFLSLHNGGIRPFFSPEKHGSQDFAQYYMGGAICLERAFDSLYPNPKENITSNMGWMHNSTPKLKYTAIAKSRGVEDSYRFVQPPPTSLLFAPLALLPYQTARYIWVIILGLCCWAMCWISYCKTVQLGASRFTTLFWTLFWAFSPLVLKSLRTANCSPIVALSLIIAALAIFHNRWATAIISCLIAGLLKGVSIIFVPFIIICRRWKIIIYGAIAIIAINVITIAVTGFDVYRELFDVIYPSTRLPDTFPANQSIYGFISRIDKEQCFDPLIVPIVKIVGTALAITVLAKIWMIRRSINLRLYIAGVVAVLGLYLIFSPYCWDHYFLSYIPFWIILLPKSSTWQTKALLLVFAALSWFPLSTIRAGTFAPAEPIQSHMLLGQLSLVIAAATELFLKNSESS